MGKFIQYKSSKEKFNFRFEDEQGNILLHGGSEISWREDTKDRIKEVRKLIKEKSNFVDMQASGNKHSFFIIDENRTVLACSGYYDTLEELENLKLKLRIEMRGDKWEDQAPYDGS